MKTTLIFNQQAGKALKLEPEQILEALRQVGFEPVYHPTETVEDLDRVLAEAGESVVVAGGDGSVRAVAIRLLGKNVKITPLPMGTANNIANMLALTSSPLEILAGLADPVERAMDMGRVKTGFGPYYFLEALGVGVFADAMKRYDPEEGKSIVRSLQTAVETLQGYQPKFFHLELDGEDLSGSYVLVEVMNTPTMGMRYQMAPDAKPDDGLFNLVLIHANQRENYLRYMANVITGNLQNLPDVSVQQGRELKIAWRGFALQVDGEIVDRLPWTESDSDEEEPNHMDVAGPFLNVDLIPKAVQFLVPRESNTEENE